MAEQRIAVVTGATRGIGRAIAEALAAKGAHIVAIGRTVGALEELDDAIRAAGGSATLVPMDLTDYPAIDRLGGSIHERWGRLDVLVGNAGVLGRLMPLRDIPPKVWDEVFAINVTANWRLIRSCDRLLRLAPAGRAVFMSSGAAHNCRPFWAPYSASKAALEAMVRSYAAEVHATSVRVNLVNPGPTRTRMRAEAVPGENPMTLPTPEQVAAAIVKLTDPGCHRNGMLYDYPKREFQSFTPPSAAV